MTRICFSAPNAAPVVFPELPGCIGGIETGAWTSALAWEQRQPGRSAFHVEYDRPLPDKDRDGVDVVCSVDRYQTARRAASDWLAGGWKSSPFQFSAIRNVVTLAATRPLRQRVPGPDDIDPTLADVNCDAYVAFGVHEQAARCMRTAQATGRKLVISIQSNADIPKSPITESSPRWKRDLFSYADLWIAQSRWQVDQLHATTGLTAHRIANPLDVDAWMGGSQDRQNVLWIGRADTHHKRPLLALEIAKQLPGTKFLLVMNPLEPEITNRVRAEQPANVSIVDQVEWRHMPELFGSAIAYLSTGSAVHEGFPNVFLQAAAAGTPIVSMNDFGDFVTQTQAGVVTGEDVVATTAELRRVLQMSPSERADRFRPDTVRQYLRDEHGLNVFAQRLERLFEE